MKSLWALGRRVWFDVLVIGAMVGASIELDHAHGKDAPTASTWVLVFCAIVIPLPLFARRQYRFAAPVAVFVAGASTSFLEPRLFAASGFLWLTTLAAEFQLGMLRERAQAVAGLALTFTFVGVVGSRDPTAGGADFVWIPLIYALAWTGGYALGYKLRQVEAVEERAARLERERLEEARAAVAEERARIARELHDVVGHSVSVMTVQAAAARRLLRPDQEKEREALLVVEQTGREALAEMRRLVGVLRRPEEAPALAPQPSLEHVEKLVAHARESGLPVELRVEGKPVPLSPGVDLTAYRLVQEGLTNALKHAAALNAEVLVRYDNDHVELTVSDDGRGSGDGDGGGHGLVGMRERVSVYGGELEAGPRPGGGFQLRARLPLS